VVGSWHEIDAALVGCRGEAREVADDAAAEREDGAIAGDTLGREEIPRAGEFAGGPGGLAVGGRDEHGHALWPAPRRTPAGRRRRRAR
jgi:hypothetical protein